MTTYLLAVALLYIAVAILARFKLVDRGEYLENIQAYFAACGDIFSDDQPFYAKAIALVVLLSLLPYPFLGLKP